MVRLGLMAMASSLAAGTPALSQDAPAEGPIAITGEAALVSDYRYRGISLSGDGPAFQLEVYASHDTGLYSSFFASTIEEYGHDDDGDGATWEVDYAIGYAFDVAGMSADVSVAYYTYPDASDVSYFVIPMSLTAEVSDMVLTAGFEHTPAQGNLGDLSGSYVWLSADRPVSETMGLTGWVGFEDGTWAPEGKFDWGATVYRSFGPASVGLTYADTDSVDGSSSLILELRASF